MPTIAIENLIQKGFKDTSWTGDEGEDYTEHTLSNEKFSIIISGVTLVELKVEKNHYITVPNCNSESELDNLIHLFNLKEVSNGNP